MPARGEVLVAIVNNLHDFAIARDNHWYRIPVASANNLLKDRWPPGWLALYQTKAFGSDAHLVRHFAQVLEIRKAYRWQLLQVSSRDPKRNRLYYQLMLGTLKQLPEPIVSRRLRRIVFIPTTWTKFVNAVEINDLWDDSPLEDRLWAEFKRLTIKAERQEYVETGDRRYFLDFAIYCTAGKIDVETDGDLWHANPERAAQDNVRDNDLETQGWRILRFNSSQINEQMAEYCVPKVVDNIARLGGVDEVGRVVPRKLDLQTLDGVQQLGLFDDTSTADDG